MTTATGVTKQERAGVTRSRNIAIRKGYAPPLAWNNIDDPNELPSTTRERTNYLADDLISEVEFLTSFGESIEQAARQLGVSVQAIEKAGERVANRGAA